MSTQVQLLPPGPIFQKLWRGSSVGQYERLITSKRRCKSCPRNHDTMMTTCIYCRQIGSRRFPREHVVPKAFGHFRDNLTLRCVCGDCNSFFAEELELFLTRDSVEALLRVRCGLKTAGGRHKLCESRLIVKVITPGDWHGARITVERNAEGTALRAEPLPQVAFRKHGETDWKWFLEEDLDQPKNWERYRTSTDTKMVGTRDGVPRLSDKLIKMGIVFKERGPLERVGNEVEAFAEGVLDDIIFRGVAKIAFNFLAHLKGVDFVLRSDFDPIRDYIRLGKAPRHGPVKVSKFPILHRDEFVYRPTNGHIIVLNWDKSQEGIVCLVSLFNHLTYHVLLCESYSGVWHPVAGGRHFDVESLKITEVRGL